MFRNVYLGQSVAFSADSSVILVGNMVERNVPVLRWDGTSLTDRGSGSRSTAARRRSVPRTAHRGRDNHKRAAGAKGGEERG
jgi:hypothetical protein